MRLLVRRTGGFAGLDDTLYDIAATSSLGAGAAELESLALSLERAVTARDRAKQPIGADFLKYEVTLGDGQSERKLIVADDGSEPAQIVHRLLDRLSALVTK